MSSEIIGVFIILIFLILIFLIPIACLHEPKKCNHCRQIINIHNDQYIMKYHRFWGHYGSNGFVYKKAYWHPWCWELEKKKRFFSERSYSDKDPNLIKQEKIESSKQEWLNNE